MYRRCFLVTVSVPFAFAAPATVVAQEGPIKVGLVLPMTGPFASTGKQIEAAVRLFVAQRGAVAGGRKVEILLRDDAGVADTTRRIAQELVANEKVAVLAGFGLTPSALAVGPMLTSAKVPAIVMGAGSNVVLPASPYFVKTSYTVGQSANAMAEWALRNKVSKVVTLVSEFAPGLEAERAFKEKFSAGGGKVLGEIRVPMRNTDFSPSLQRVRDSAPDAVYIFIPSGPSAVLMKQFRERGLDTAGIKIIGDGGVTDDDSLNDMGDSALGVVTAFHYSAAHDSPLNKKFVEAFQTGNKGLRPNFMAVGGYDGMTALYNALASTKGQGGGDTLLAALKKQSFESPRGPIAINPQTGDVVQNMYVRRVGRKDSQLFNVEIDVFSPAAVATK